MRMAGPHIPYAQGWLPGLHATTAGRRLNYLQGTCVLQSPEMHHPEALSQMRMPDHETCIEVPKSSIMALLEEDSGPDRPRTA